MFLFCLLCFVLYYFTKKGKQRQWLTATNNIHVACKDLYSIIYNVKNIRNMMYIVHNYVHFHDPLPLPHP